jgi:hypothetical protein
MLRETLLYAGQLAEGAASVWFVSWALRRRYELDYKLDRREQILRWAVIAFTFGLALLPGPNFAAVRIVVGISGIAFLAWPNLAHHTMGLAEQVHLAKGSYRAGGPDPDS